MMRAKVPQTLYLPPLNISRHIRSAITRSVKPLQSHTSGLMYFDNQTLPGIMCLGVGVFLAQYRKHLHIHPSLIRLSNWRLPLEARRDLSLSGEILLHRAKYFPPCKWNFFPAKCKLLVGGAHLAKYVYQKLKINMHRLGARTQTGEFIMPVEYVSDYDYPIRSCNSTE